MYNPLKVLTVHQTIKTYSQALSGMLQKVMQTKYLLLYFFKRLFSHLRLSSNFERAKTPDSYLPSPSIIASGSSACQYTSKCFHQICAILWNSEEAFYVKKDRLLRLFNIPNFFYQTAPQPLIRGHCEFFSILFGEISKIRTSPRKSLMRAGETIWWKNLKRQSL